MNYPIEILINRYRSVASAEDALSMSAYLKNKFVSLGIRSPQRRELTKNFLKEFGKPEKIQLGEIVHKLYDLDEREFHYLAMDMAALFKKKWEIEDLGLIEHMMLNRQWWDTIDFIASHLTGSYLLKFPQLIDQTNSEYINHPNFWVRRVALLFQLKYKEDLNPELLASNIEKCAYEKEFFIEKAIGWILREYSKRHPEWVRDFIRNHELRPLSIREGSKYL